jgi:hypothetical protein
MNIKGAQASLFALLLTVTFGLHAAELEWKKKSVIVEYVTSVIVATYPEPLKMEMQKQNLTSYFTIEGAINAQFSAMARGDFDAWLAGWSKDSRELMLKRYAESGRKPADIVENWKGVLTTQPVYLVGQAQYARAGVNYALVRYRMKTLNELTTVDKVTGKTKSLGTKDFENTLVFRKNQEKWEAVQDLASDPVLGSSEMLWDATKSEIRITRPAP